jgi:hypothetical protein
MCKGDPHSRRSSIGVPIQVIRSCSTPSTCCTSTERTLAGQPLLKRRARLPRVLEDSRILLSQELPGTAAAIVEAVRGLGLEG